MKNYITTASGITGAFLSYLIGGWNEVTTTLLIFMLLDELTGFFIASILKNSPKTETGGLSSKIGFQGLMKKCLILVFLVVATRLDMLLGTKYIRDGVCYAFIVNQLISLIENAGLMGFTVPTILTNAIDVLKNKDGSNNQ